MDKEKMGLFIAELRKEKGLTQEELAQQFYVDRATISKWEKGYYIPTPEMLLELSNFFGITVNEILLGEKKSEKNQEEVNKVTVEILKNRDRKVKKIIRTSAAMILLIVMIGIGVSTFIKLDANRRVAAIEKKKTWLETLEENQVPYYLAREDIANDFGKEHFQSGDKVDIYIQGNLISSEYQEEPFITNIVLKKFGNQAGELKDEGTDFSYIYFGIDSEAQIYLKKFSFFQSPTFQDAKLYFVKTNSTEIKNEVNEKIKRQIDKGVVPVEIEE